MEATKARKKLIEIYATLTDDEQKDAIDVAILALDTCIRSCLLYCVTNSPLPGDSRERI